MEVKGAVLLLINQLMQSAPDLSSKERLMVKLTRRLGLDMRLSSQLHLQEPSFRQPLDVYQLVATPPTPGSGHRLA